MVRLLAVRIGAIAGICATLWGTLSLYSPAFATSGGLTLTAAAVGSVAGGELVVVQVTNTAAARVNCLEVATAAPFGVTVRPVAFAQASIGPGASTLFRFKLTGGPAHLPGSLVITVTGRQGVIPVSAVGAVALTAKEADVQVTLSGDDTITDTSPATDIAILQNLVDDPVTVILTASAGSNVVSLAQTEGQPAKAAVPGPLTLRLQPNAVASVAVQTTGHLPLSRGSVPLVLTAMATGADGVTSEVIAAKNLQVSLAADLLPAPLGVSSVVLVPGLMAIWAIVAAYQRDRRRIGLQTSSAAAQVWDNKILLIAAIFISVFAAGLYGFFGLGDIWSAPTVSGIIILSAASAVIGGLAVDLVLFLRRRIRTPAVSPGSDPWDVLNAAVRANGSNARQVYRSADDLRGLLVHMDFGASVLTPPIWSADDIQDMSLTDAIAFLKGTRNPREHVQFLAEGYVRGPGAVTNATLLAGQEEPILQYAQGD